MPTKRLIFYRRDGTISRIVRCEPDSVEANINHRLDGEMLLEDDFEDDDTRTYSHRVDPRTKTVVKR